MKYKDIMGYTKKQPKKKVVEEKIKSEKTILDGIKEELNEWSYQPPTVKRWSKKFNGKQGLTEFEQQGGTDNVKLGKVYTDKDRPPFKTESQMNEGPSYEYANYMKKIEKAENNQAKEVNKFVRLLMKKGLKKEATAVASKYVRGVAEFDNFLQKIYEKLT